MAAAGIKYMLPFLCLDLGGLLPVHRCMLHARLPSEMSLKAAALLSGYVYFWKGTVMETVPAEDITAGGQQKHKAVGDRLEIIIQYLSLVRQANPSREGTGIRSYHRITSKLFASHPADGDCYIRIDPIKSANFGNSQVTLSGCN